MGVLAAAHGQVIARLGGTARRAALIVVLALAVIAAVINPEGSVHVVKSAAGGAGHVGVGFYHWGVRVVRAL